MQRFSNLDIAEIQSANVNDLIKDVAALLEPKYKGKVDVTDRPASRCRRWCADRSN